MDIQLIELRESTLWGAKFITLREELENVERDRATLISQKQWRALRSLPDVDKLVLQAWTKLPDSFDALKKVAFAMITIFGSSYCCEQIFSQMNIIQTKLRNRLTDRSTDACLRLKQTSYEPDIQVLAAKKQHQKSH